MAIPRVFHFTKHAKQRSGERKITEPLFIEVVTNHEHKTQRYRGTHGGIVYVFSKAIGNNRLTVVAEVFKDQCYFLTGFWK